MGPFLRLEAPDEPPDEGDEPHDERGEPPSESSLVCPEGNGRLWWSAFTDAHRCSRRRLSDDLFDLMTLESLPVRTLERLAGQYAWASLVTRPLAVSATRARWMPVPPGDTGGRYIDDPNPTWRFGVPRVRRVWDSGPPRVPRALEFGSEGVRLVGRIEEIFRDYTDMFRLGSNPESESEPDSEFDSEEIPDLIDLEDLRLDLGRGR